MKNKIKIFCVFLCCLIFICTAIYIVYSKYRNSLKLKTNTEIAEPILEIITENVDGKIVDVLNDNKYLYEFQVRNFNDKNEVSEVEFKYNIEFVLSQDNAPVKINLYKSNDLGEEKIELQNNKTIEYEVLSLDKNINSYKAEIVYDKSSSIVMEENLDIKLRIHGVQEKEENI